MQCVYPPTYLPIDEVYSVSFYHWYNTFEDKASEVIFAPDETCSSNTYKWFNTEWDADHISSEYVYHMPGKLWLSQGSSVIFTDCRMSRKARHRQDARYIQKLYLRLIVVKPRTLGRISINLEMDLCSYVTGGHHWSYLCCSCYILVYLKGINASDQIRMSFPCTVKTDDTHAILFYFKKM